jgi:DNA-binding IclR family transcriptional regulator
VQREDDEDKGQRGIQSVEVGGRLLQALATHPSSMTLKDLAAAAALPASRAHPYLVSFGKLGLVEQDPHTGRYALGPMALQMGLSCLHQLDPIKAATPVAEALARQIDQTVVIAVWANFGPTVVRLIEGSQALHVNMRAGTVMSILGTATGRAFAAVLPASQLQQAMRGRGERSPVKNLARALKEVSAEVRAQGLARAMGRPIPGINAFSAPAFDHEGRAALVITALGHEDHFSPAWDSLEAGGVRQAAADISMRLGFRR